MVIMEGLGLGVSVSVRVRVMVQVTEKLVATGVLVRLRRTIVLSETNSLRFNSVPSEIETEKLTHIRIFCGKNSFSCSSITN